MSAPHRGKRVRTRRVGVIRDKHPMRQVCHTGYGES